MFNPRFCVVWALLATPMISQAQVTVTEYLVPGGNADNICAGPDGALWFTEHFGNNIGRITTAGVVTEFPAPTPSSGLDGITKGPDGNLWFAEFDASNIGKITSSGAITEFPVSSGSGPAEIITGSDGNIWFTEYSGNNIGRITPGGLLTEFPVPTPNSIPYGITIGPDGNLWFSERAGTNIGTISYTGVITEFQAPSPGAYAGIAAGPDGNLWYSEENGGAGDTDSIDRISPAGVISKFAVPTISAGSYGITAGTNNDLWFVEYYGNNIGRITTGGMITEYPVPTSGSGPLWIATGPDGNLWFTEWLGNKIGKVNIGPRYHVCLLYDATKAVKSGATDPIKVQLCDSSGNDLSSPGITLHAVSVTQVSTSISGPVEDPGNSNPDDDFRFDPTLGTTGGYIFNLKTTGLSRGTYTLNFMLTGDSSVHSAPFQVK